MKSLTTVALVLCLSCIPIIPSVVEAKPNHHLEDVGEDEGPYVPFDDSLADDDFYGNVGDFGGDRLTTKSPVTIATRAGDFDDAQIGIRHDFSKHDLTTAVSSSRVTESSATLTRSRGIEKIINGNDDDEVDEGDRVEDSENYKNGDSDTKMDGDTKMWPDDINEAEADIDDHDIPKFHDPCRYIFCRMGRVCKPNAGGRGECVCANADHCHHRKSKNVCGSDGSFYPSHCELHRAACLNGIHIKIDQTGIACKDRNDSHHFTPISPPSMTKAATRVVDDSGRVGQSQASSKSTVGTTTPGHCTPDEMKRLKLRLVAYHCSGLGQHFDCLEVHHKRIIVGNIFSYYDRNGDRNLDLDELKEGGMRDHVDKMSAVCRLTDMLRLNDDSDTDGRISLVEFFSAFAISAVTLDDSLVTYTTTVTVGNSVELKCDVKGVDRIVWKRKGHSVEGTVDKQIRVFDDGSLYIGDLRLDHMGNYTCQDRLSSSVIQTHVLLVQTLPVVRVYPSAQVHLSGAGVTLKCRADGVPQPEVTWEKNEWPLSSASEENKRRYLFLHNRTVLEIKSADYKVDTGEYKCKAKNSAGTSDAVATVFIENVDSLKHATGVKQNELFTIFHDGGYMVYEVGHCHSEHQVAADYHDFKTVPSGGGHVFPRPLCPVNETCVWSDAVVARNKFIYVAQPKLHRVVVVEITDRFNPVELIMTENEPVKLDYIEDLDEVWVTCAKGQHSKEVTGSKVIVVIRKASADLRHSAAPAPLEATDAKILDDEVTNVFLPTSNNLKHSFQFGYVAFGNKMALQKLHLASVKYTKEIGLGQYDCMPKSIQFIPIGGQIVVGCSSDESDDKPSFHLVVDYVTDQVIDTLSVNGYSYLSPDVRSLVIVGDHGNAVFVFKITDDGQLEHIFDEYTQLHLDRLAFFPSEFGYDYDAFLTSADQSSVLHMDLRSGRVSITEGLGEPLPTSQQPWAKHNRVIVSGGPFGEYVMTSSKKSAIVIDGRRRRVQCEWQDVVNGNVMVATPTEGRGE